MLARNLLAALLLSSSFLVGGELRAESSERSYQRDSVQSVGGRALRAATWVKDRLSGFHVTPARLMVGLGLVGVLVTWNKNKRKASWAAVTGLSWLLLLGGAIAIVSGWSVLA